MKQSKRLSALLLALCLIVSMIVPAVYAEGSKEINITVDPITGKIAAEDAVTSVNCLLAASDEIDGQDYVYLFFNGGKMYVYNLDTGKLVNKVSNCFGTTRAVYIDENHILWATGANANLYRYDPATKSGEMIPIEGEGLFPEASTSFNGFGLTGDGKGNLYFGTYPAAYVAKYDTKTGKFSQLGGLLSAPGQEPDATRSGQGGLVYNNGYLYLEIEGNKNNDNTKTNQIIKFDLNTNKVVDYVDILKPMDDYAYLDEITLVGDLLLCSSAKATKGSIAIDISGEKMELITDISGLTTGFNGAVSPEVDGKVYMMSNNQRGLLEYDIAQQKVTAENVMSDKGALKFHDCFVTLEGNDQMPGKSLVTFVTGVANRIDLVLYNLQTKNTVVLEDVTEGQGSGNQLRALMAMPDGKTVLVSSYGCNHMSVYDLESGKVIKQHPTINTQIESFVYYEGEVYIGNYSSCTVSRIDVETGAYTRLVQLGTSVFSQHRLHATAAGDGKVFFGTAPAKYRLGGVLIWYDVESDRCYVAAGPNPEDVFYTPSGASKGGETGNVSNQEWYSALTGKLALTDADDPYINGTDQRFYGPIDKQTINCMVYQDGYIYGSTSRSGGSQSDNTGVGNACLFVYDVKAMKVVATCDLTEEIDGLKTDVPVDFIDGIEADPDVPGKFWGVVSDTLFSFTYDAENGFAVNTELSFGTTAYNHGSNLHQDRSIVMDGDFMYVAFGSYGTYMVYRDDPQVYYKLSDVVPKQMVLAADGNLYYHNNTVNLMVLEIAETAQKVKDAYGLVKTQELIDALDTADKITLEDEAAVLAARKEYNKLSDAAKEKVNAEKLTAAETVLKPLQQAAADAVIAKITAIGEVTLEREAAVKEARAAYDALSDNLKSMITNLPELIAAEAAIDYLKVPAEDRAAAAVVDGKIESIGTVDRYSGPFIESARTAYDKLTDDQKKLVKNLDVLTAAEVAYAEAKEAINELYNFDYINSGMTYKGNSLFSEEKLLMYMRDYYSKGENNYDLKQIQYTNTGAACAVFNGAGYYQGRSVPGDFIAFTIKNPGQGKYELNISYMATLCGAEEIAVYIIPADTEDIGAALTEQYLVGTYNCYDPSVDVEKPTIDKKRSSVLGTWSAGTAEEYILVYKCAKASEEALANIPARKENGDVYDFGSNTYICQLSMNLIDEQVVEVQKMIDAIGTVTLESEAAIKEVRAAYDALTKGQKTVVDAAALIDAEKDLAAQKKFNAMYDFSTKNHGISGSITVDNAKLLANLNNAYADPNGTLNWNYKGRDYAASNADAWFVGHEYFRSRNVANGDWIAFTIDGPGAGNWKLTIANHACKNGVAKVNVYLLPGDTTDIGAALTQENLVGDYTCYDENVSAHTPSIAANTMNIKTTEFADLWVSGDDETHILVLQVAEASSSASYLYLSSVAMTSEDTDVPAVEKAIADIGEVTLDSKEAIEAARTAYDALCDRQKAQITNYNVLTAAETKLAELQYVVDKAAADLVDAKIEAIGTVTLESEEAIKAAREAFNALTESQKELANEAKLTEAEAKLAQLQKEAADKAAAAEVTAKIEAIGEVKLESEEAIKAARAAYNALTADQKALVDTTKLTAAETKLAELKAAAKEAADKAAAAEVTAKIEAIGEVKLESEEAIKAAREAFKALTADQKKLVDETKLTAAEAKLAELKAAAEKAAADKAAADAVNAKINAIGEVKLESEQLIKDAREAFDALTADQKKLADEEKLTAAETKLAELKAAAEKAAADKAAADAVTGKIEAIGTVTLESEEAIKAARAAYDALTADQKKLVDETKLTAAETKLGELKAAAEKAAADKAAADAVAAQIEAVGKVTLESKNAIAAARAAYEALTAEQKALVTNLNVLTAAEASLAALENPKTGETVPMALVAGILALSAAAAVALLAENKKRVVNR